MANGNPSICAACGRAGHTAGKCPDRGKALDVPEVVRAHRFELLGFDDLVIATLEPIGTENPWARGSARLVLCNAAGDRLVQITAHPESGEVLVRRADNSNAIAVLDAEDGYHDGLANAA